MRSRFFLLGLSLLFVSTSALSKEPEIILPFSSDDWANIDADLSVVRKQIFAVKQELEEARKAQESLMAKLIQVHDRIEHMTELEDRLLHNEMGLMGQQTEIILNFTDGIVVTLCDRLSDEALAFMKLQCVRE